jgi:capsular exopolysaccharide synthesis family protein
MQSQPIKINFKEEIFKYLHYWKWILLSIVIILFGCYIYLRYANDVYDTSAKIQVLDSSSSAFKMQNEGTSIFGVSKVNLENQIENLKSSRIVGNVVDSLNLTTEIYSVGRLKSDELWNNAPFDVLWALEKDSIINSTGNFEIETTRNGYKLNNSEKVYKFDQTNFDFIVPFKLKLKSKISLSKIEGRTYSIYLKNKKSVCKTISKRLTIDYVGNQSDILRISLTGYNPNKITDIVNSLIAVFNNDGMKDRKFVHQKTVDFVDKRFDYLYNELDSIEQSKSNYKRNNEFVNVDNDANILMQSAYRSKSDLDKANTQIALSKLMMLSINKSKDMELLPPNIGLEDQEINDLVNKYNQEIFKYKRLIQTGAGESNPLVKETVSQVYQLKNNIKSSIIGYQKGLEINRSDLTKINSQEKSKFGSVPNKEKNIRSIERQQTIKENLYVLLLQKREEALVNLAITNPSIKIVEEASFSTSPIFPDRKSYYSIALLIGIIIPFIIIYINNLFYDKIKTKEDIEEEVKDVVVIAEIPNIEVEQKKVTSLDRSMLSESFRILTSNIKFISSLKDEENVIYVTSSVKGEGKTFVSTNLAITLSSFGKKVVLVGADLRNPQLHNSLDLKKVLVRGVTNYLHDATLTADDIITKNIEEDSNLDVIISGIIPQNPAELLSNGRFKMLLNELKTKYEYIIVDTAPTVLVTDTSLILELADVILYVTRADYTEKKLLKFISNFKKLNTIKTMGIILNNIELNNRYGYKYNYGYNYGYDNQENDKLKSTFFRKIKEYFSSSKKKQL